MPLGIEWQMREIGGQAWRPPRQRGLMDTAKRADTERKMAMRFSLRSLFGITAFAAVSCACLIYATETVYSWLSNVLQLSLMLCVLAAFYAPRERRAFCGGYAIIGWAYFWIAFNPPSTPEPGDLVRWALAKTYRTIAREVEPAEIEVAPGTYRIQRPKTFPIYQDYLHVGHALATFIAASIGGSVAFWLDSRARR